MELFLQIGHIGMIVVACTMMTVGAALLLAVMISATRSVQKVADQALLATPSDPSFFMEIHEPRALLATPVS
jgi:hypothetical protein